MFETVSISSKRQIVIPSKLYTALKLRKGQKLIAEIRGDAVVLTPAESLVEKTAGMIKVNRRISDQELKKQIREAKKIQAKRFL